MSDLFVKYKMSHSILYLTIKAGITGCWNLVLKVWRRVLVLEL